MQVEIKEKIAKLIDETESGQLVSGVNKILIELQKAGYLRSQTIEPHLVGVHHLNRDGLGISGKDTMDLLKDIFHIGWDGSKVDAICVEVSDVDKAFAFQEQLTRMSKGAIPPMQKHQLLYQSLAGSHTNAGLRAILANSETDIVEMAVDGRLNLSMVEQHDPEMANACKHGLRWRVVSRQALEEFPTLALLIQSAQNAAGQIQRGEHEIQLFFGRMVKISFFFNQKLRRVKKLCLISFHFGASTFNTLPGSDESSP